MPLTDFADQTWQPKPVHGHECINDIPEPYRTWLLDSGSLTQRLKSMCTKEFRVRVLKHEWGIPPRSEQDFLGCNHEMASIRQVLLMVDDQPRVFARSVLPATSLTGANRELLELGDRPLGEFLFKQPSLERGPIEIDRLSASQFNDYLDKPYQKEQSWGRRSLFLLNGKAISVCEFFLPEYDLTPM
ncbi:chorismate--pyruvate lyase family protein [Endozoicomonas montiporae]|uniref:Probable chorismate pyruvate-lyase n=1 Tax=Endozoicomonas montiporae CL-33 TaxID=570277 RepID=A0A142BIW8_9GAMM|nr:chorismate lyase [Endozoicomonas montiporae]AMO58694.1 chorismate--pyruvate lyase [Endozoicomonas montiporae CL-33]